jgi:chemotaxis protein methyltransferase CheR
MNAPARRRSEPIHEGEFVLTQRNFDQIASTLRAQSGIALTPAKATLVYSRLAKRLRKLGFQDFDQYCAFVESEAGADERSEMLAALTTNVTRFFREPHHFDHLRQKVLPALVNVARDGGRVRIWSSACSTGEEPYSIALTVLEALPDAARYDVRILATDIDPKVVAAARAGRYRADAVEPIPPALRERWLNKESGADAMWQVSDALRQLITFNELNLIGEWPMRGRFDIIFCRNVVIYFEDETQAAIWTRFRDKLTPQGRLYIGHSERIDVPGFLSDGLTIYRLASAGARL